MDPRRVLTFRQVALQRSFSRAARTLSLTQPSVSHQVAQLEREVGGRLLERGPGGPTPTPAGEALLVHAEAIAARFALAEAQLAEILRAEDAHLRVGANPSALAGLVPTALQHVREQHPDALVSVTEGRSDELPARVQTGDLHLAVSFQDAARGRDSFEGLERHELLRERFLLALPPGHRLERQDRIRLADLAEDDWIAPSADGIIVRACREAGFEPRLVSVTRDQLAIRALINHGLAVTLVGEVFAEALDVGVLRPIAGGCPEREVYALVPTGRRHPLAAPMLEALSGGARALSRQDS